MTAAAPIEQAIVEETITAPPPDEDSASPEASEKDSVPAGPGDRWKRFRARWMATWKARKSERLRLAQSIAGKETALKKAEERRRANLNGNTIAAVENLKRDLAAPRERLAKLDAEIAKAEEEIGLCDYLIENPPPERDPSDPAQHPIVTELKNELAKAQDELEDASCADDAAQAALERAETAFGRNPVNSTREDWQKAQEQSVIARERRKDATRRVEKLRVRLADKDTLARQRREYDERERQTAIRQRELDELAERTYAAGVAIAGLIRQHKELRLDEYAMRRAIMAGIESTGLSPWDAKYWVRPF